MGLIKKWWAHSATISMISHCKQMKDSRYAVGIRPHARLKSSKTRDFLGFVLWILMSNNHSKALNSDDLNMGYYNPKELASQRFHLYAFDHIGY
jgi:hypothetical protein